LNNYFSYLRGKLLERSFPRTPFKNFSKLKTQNSNLKLLSIVKLYFLGGLCPLTPTMTLALQAVPQKGPGLQKTSISIDT
jgi:hypothetical protein